MLLQAGGTVYNEGTAGDREPHPNAPAQKSMTDTTILPFNSHRKSEVV